MDENAALLRDPAAVEAVLEEILPRLAAWMRDRRWFVRGAGAPRLTLRGWAPLPAVPGAEGTLALHVVVRCRAAEAGGGEPPRDYQVPLVLGAPAPAEPDAVIGGIERDGRRLQVRDAAADDIGRRALLALLDAPPSAPGAGSLALAPEAVRARRPHAGVRASRLLSGEQSNSSMILELEGTGAVIAKLFRALQEGPNPDVEVQDVLDAAGCARVAPMIGAVRLRGPGDPPWEGHALVVQGYLEGVQDAWRTALELARSGEDFSTGARELGEATAEVHAVLAREMPVVPADAPSRGRILRQMRDRLAAVGAAVPQVARHEAELRALLERASGAAWPDLQRIHGDYHLGQVLAVPDRGWVLLDFEGEPLRPLSQRRAEDSPLRDVAGMLRSLDYVGAAVRREHGTDASAWCAAARDAFWEGYCRRAGWDPGALADLVTVFEADKAVYEALYELRHRPDWLEIPLEAIERISRRAAAAG